MHVRNHTALTARAEKRLLVWIAERLPLAVTSDHLSALGLFSMAGVGLSFWLAGTAPALGLPLVVGCLALNWFGDSLDGTVARVRNQQRPRYGFYVDHVIDITGSTLMFGGLALSGYMSPMVALFVIIAWLMVSAESFLATHARGMFTMAFLGVGPTELRILIAAGALALFGGGSVMPFGAGPYRLFDIGGVTGAAGMVAAFIVTAARNTRALYVEETVWR
jgi:phosphatidylglycerophosphate synthase